MAGTSFLKSAAAAGAILLLGCGGEETDSDTEIKRSSLFVAADPPGHTFEDSVTVELAAGGPAEIFYTLNGMTPFGDAAIAYSGPIVLDANALLTFVAKDGDLFSEQVTELYELKSDSVAPDMVARALSLDDDQIVFSARRGEANLLEKSVRVRSVGIQQVLIHSIYLDVNPDSWSFWEEGAFTMRDEAELASSRYLKPGESMDLVVRYRPTETLRTAVIVIESDDQRAKDGVLRVGLTGRIWDW
jgi:hypothetical protein